MSRREAIIKGYAGALGPDTLDLTAFRQRSVRDRTVKVKREDAAGALGFGASDWDDGEDSGNGRTLSAMLLRLKYAEQRSHGLFTRAHRLIVDRGESDDKKRSELLYAIGLAAVFEWAHDHCVKCRGARPRADRMEPCTACGQGPNPKPDRTTVKGRLVELERNGKPMAKAAHRIDPEPGCPRCFGLSRIFKVAKPRLGMRCATCANSGRVTFSVKQRWELVTGHLKKAQKARGQKPEGIKFAFFAKRWLPKYKAMIDVLRETDKSIVEGLDDQLYSLHRRPTSDEPVAQFEDDE